MLEYPFFFTIYLVGYYLGGIKGKNNNIVWAGKPVGDTRIRAGDMVNMPDRHLLSPAV